VVLVKPHLISWSRWPCGQSRRKLSAPTVDETDFSGRLSGWP
jgi:hypothetical protein